MKVVRSHQTGSSWTGLAEDKVLRTDDADTIARLREVLTRVGYTDANVRRALGTEVTSGHRLADLPVYVRRLASADPLQVLIRLFMLGVPVERAAAATALAPLAPERLATLGLLEMDVAEVRAPLGLTSHEGLFLIHDRYVQDAARVRADHVLGVNPTTLTLAAVTVRRPVASALDLGAGCGVQGLLAARHSARVVAVDANPRAARFTRFNALLNDVHYLESREGNLFGPVAGDRFDLIACNPPYVISPESRYQYRDGGLPGDALCAAVVRQAPAFLTEGGFACVLCNWGLRAGEEWSAPLRQWVEGSGCDVWLLHSETQDVLTYAAVWNQQPDAVVYGEALDRWLAYDRALGIEGIGAGALILRRRSEGPNWVRADDLPKGARSACSEHILRVFAAEDALAGLRDEAALLGQTFRMTEDARLDQTLARREGGFVVEEMRLRLTRGIGYEALVDVQVLQVLSRCDGRRPLGQVVTEIAAQMKLDVDGFTRSVLRVVRRLFALGFLVKGEPTPAA